MKRETMMQLHGNFEGSIHLHPESGVEFWFARELQSLLGYSRWENFAKVISKAVEACENSDVPPQNHFLETTKMVTLGSAAKRPVDDFILTRYACYLIAQNGDASKEQIAFAQTYFAVQTRAQGVREFPPGELPPQAASYQFRAGQQDWSPISYRNGEFAGQTR